MKCRFDCCLCQRGDDKFNERQLIISLLDLHMAGTDTTGNTFLTAFLHLTTHPDVQGELSVMFLWLLTGLQQPLSWSLSDVCHLSLWSPERCQKEIDEVLGETEQASFEDRHRMPYTQAMIHEALRVADTAPLSIFHTTNKDTRLMGYDIPKVRL